MMSTDDALAEVARIPDRASAAACFGTPVSAGDRVVIPVADVAYAFGLGWGGSQPQDVPGGRGGGAGGGARTRGVAVIEVGPTGVHILPIEDNTSIRLAGIAFAAGATTIVARTLLKLVRG